jgi:molybdopterin converting factor small subunit
VGKPAERSVDVLLFGPAARAASASSVSVLVPEPCAASEVLERLPQQHPAITFALPGSRLAVNHAFAAADTVIRPGDELALIAMVSGG